MGDNNRKFAILNEIKYLQKARESFFLHFERIMTRSLVDYFARFRECARSDRSCISRESSTRDLDLNRYSRCGCVFSTPGNASGIHPSIFLCNSARSIFFDRWQFSISVAIIKLQVRKEDAILWWDTHRTLTASFACTVTCTAVVAQRQISGSDTNITERTQDATIYCFVFYRSHCNALSLTRNYMKYFGTIAVRMSSAFYEKKHK